MAKMAGRIAGVRSELQAALEKRCPDKDWSFITQQIGMFSFTGMTPQQVRLLAEAVPALQKPGLGGKELLDLLWAQAAWAVKDMCVQQPGVRALLAQYCFCCSCVHYSSQITA